MKITWSRIAVLVVVAITDPLVVAVTAARFKPQPHFTRPLSLSLTDELSLLSSRRQICVSPNATSHTRHLTTATTSISSHVRRRQQQQDTTTEITSSSSSRNKESREYATPLRAFYYFIQALGNSESSGCKHPQPSFTATCPVGAFIVSQSSKSEWTSRLDCQQTDETSIHCVPKEFNPEIQEDIGDSDNNVDIDMDDQNGVVVACYAGDDEELLQVSVQVHAGSYFCDKALDVKTLPHPTVIAGGNVYQTVAIQKQCWSDDGDVESWIFVEPACGSGGGSSSSNSDPATTTTIDREQTAANIPEGGEDMLQHTEVPIQVGDEASTKGSGGVGGENTLVPTAIIAHCQTQDNCTAELECSPRCAGKSWCNVDLPGFTTTSTSTMTTASPPDDCFPRDFALDLDNGESCEFNLVCNSGVCVHGVCESARKEHHDTCEESVDCLSQACGKHPLTNISSIESTSIPGKTCCPSGGTFGHQGESFCTASQTVDAACHKDAMCESKICIFNTCRPKLLDDGIECEESNDCIGGECGHYHDLSVTICCPTGESIILSEGPMCSNRQQDDTCENSANSLCQSNICVEGVCEGIQEVSEGCDNHFDCLNDACALGKANPSAPYICCPTGEYVFLSNGKDGNNVASTITPNSRAFDAFPINGLRVCTGQPLGASCGKEQDVDDMCESGLCIAGTCHAARRESGTACVLDADCENYVCALSSLDEDSTTICCPSNDHKHVYEPETEQLKDVCTGQPIGALCGHHNIDVLCDSGSCMGSICRENEP